MTRKFNPSQDAVLQTVSKLVLEGRPTMEISDALLFMGAALLARSGLDPDLISYLLDVTKKVSASPDHEMVKEFAAYVQPS